MNKAYAGRNPAIIVIEGLAANLLFGSLFVWSVLRNPFLELFPTWTEGMLSIIFGIHNLFVCLGILLAGQMRKKLSARQTMVVFLVMSGGGLCSFALLPVDHPTLSFVLSFVFFCCFTATGVGIGINTVQSTTIPWFPRNSGAISGALYMALGVSSVILAAVARRLLTVMSAKFVLPVFGAVIVIVALLILADKHSITAPAAETAAVANEGADTKTMLRSATFVILILWNICLRTCGLILLDHSASMAEFFGGAVLVAMLIAPANGLGSISAGCLMDRIGLKKITLIVSIVMLVAAVTLVVGTSSAVFTSILAAMLIGGFAYGGSSSAYAAGVKNGFGSKYYTQNFAVSNIAMGIAALLESTSGTVLDVFGSYQAISVMVLVFAISAVLLALAGQKLLVPYYNKESYLEKNE